VSESQHIEEISYIIEAHSIFVFQCKALDEDYLLSVSKLLYPQIAKNYHTTSSSVERDIRTVIRVCWERGNRRLLQEIALRPLDSQPTSSEFLDILTAHLRQKEAVAVLV